jgi:hypothetical protein
LPSDVWFADARHSCAGGQYSIKVAVNALHSIRAVSGLLRPQVSAETWEEAMAVHHIKMVGRHINPVKRN